MERIKRYYFKSIRKRKKQRQRKGLNIWNDNIPKSIKEKSEAYKKWLQTRLSTDRSEYKKKCAIAKREVRKLNQESWDIYVSNIEYAYMMHKLWHIKSCHI